MRAQFKQDGVIYAPQLIPELMIQSLRRECDDLLSHKEWQDKSNMRCRYALCADTGEQILDAIDPISDFLPSARTIAHHKALLDALKDILEDDVHLFKDKLLLRPKRAPGYPPHQDFIAWPFFPKSFTTALIAVDAMSSKNGGLSFYPGSQNQGLMAKADGDFHTISRSELSHLTLTSFDLAPGDALIFDAFVVHESNANLFSETRKALYLSYNAASDGGDQKQAHYRYFHSWIKRRFSEYGTESLYFK